MIKGIGIDIVEIKRIQKLIKQYGDRFLTRTFTEKEIQYCQCKPEPAQHYAGRFAVKEALIKALGKPLVLNQIEIDKGPRIKLNGEAKKIVGDKKIHLSISHDNEYAVGQVVVED